MVHRDINPYIVAKIKRTGKRNWLQAYLSGDLD
jgi:hypothetical protein